LEGIVRVLVDRLTVRRLHSQRARQAVIYGPDNTVIDSF
jgi:hypothetical protein